MSDTTYVSQLHANDDAKFFSDVYIYGNLYYDLDGTDNLNDPKYEADGTTPLMERDYSV